MEGGGEGGTARMSVPRAAGAPTQLSAAMVLSSPQRLNAVKEYELCLRSLRISRIENLGCTRDQFDTIDFCDNDIVRVEGFPKLCRLKTLLISNNRYASAADLFPRSTRLPQKAFALLY